MYNETIIYALITGHRARHVYIDGKSKTLVVENSKSLPRRAPLLYIHGVRTVAKWWMRLFGIARLVVQLHPTNKKFAICAGPTDDIQKLEIGITRQIRQELESTILSIKNYIDQFDAGINKTLTPGRYVRGSRYCTFLDQQRAAYKAIQTSVEILRRHPLSLNVNDSDQVLQRVVQIELILQSGDIHREKHNDVVMKHQAVSEADYFASVESTRLSKEQVNASLTFNDANLTIAAAGSGKTSVIVSKVGFALKNEIFQEDEILVLAFNAKAAKEIRERLNERVGKYLGRRALKVRSLTFHAIGLHLWMKKVGKRPKLIDFSSKKSGRPIIIKSLQNLIVSDAQFAEKLFEWAAYHRYPIPESLTTEKLDAVDLDALEQRYSHLCRLFVREKAGRWDTPVPTFDPLVFVRSFEEARICNWLYLRGVNFRYERNVPKWITKKINEGMPPDGQIADYRPDFSYLHPTEPNRTYFHEHFALNKNGQAPPFLGGTSYAARASHKRKILTETFAGEDSKSGKPRFFETRSAHFTDGTLFEKLETELRRRDIAIGEVNIPLRTKSLLALCQSESFIDFISSFVAKFRDSGLTFTELNKRATELTHANHRRAQSFLSLMERLDADLRVMIDASLKTDRPLLDFSMMISEATRLLRDREIPDIKYKFVLVDEFQDIARSRAMLVQSLLDQHPDESILYCVGDDWQAINRFAGSDISIFRNLYEANPDLSAYQSNTPIFPRPTDVTRLSETYRCDQGIANTAKSFVMNGSKGIHIDKEVKSKFSSTEPVIRITEHHDNADARLGALRSVLNRLVEKPPIVDGGKPRAARVLVLTRQRKDQALPEGISSGALENLISTYSSKGLEVEWQTLHTSKGLGSDYVVIVGMDSGYKGFPKDYPSDPILQLLLPPLADLWDEERRLFYVGLTRARYEVTLLCAANRPSIFVHELLQQRGNDSISYESISDVIRHLCPSCTRSWLIRRESIVNCMRYPYCGYQAKPDRYPDLPVQTFLKSNHAS